MRAKRTYDSVSDLADVNPTDSTFLVGDGSAFVGESGAIARASLGVAIGSDVQAWDNDLDDLAGLGHSSNGFMVSDGTDWTAKTLAETGAILEGDIVHGNLQGLSTGSDHSYIDQDVTSGSSPTFDGTNFTGVDAVNVDIADAGGYFTGTEAETALQELGLTRVETELHGFVDNKETSISFDDSTYVFTLTDTGSGWSYYRDGIKHTISGDKTTTLSGTPPTAGTYFIVIDATDGTLSNSTTPWTLTDGQVPVAFIEWNNGLTPKYILADERHTILSNKTQHRYEHLTYGTRLETSGAISGYTIESDVDADKQFNVAETKIWDEDLQSTLAALTGGTDDYHIAYRTGASTWEWKQDAMPFDYTSYINYDNAGTMTEGQDDRFYTTYLIATNKTGLPRFTIVHGQSEFKDNDDAEAERFSDLTLDGLDIAEGVAIWKFIWETSSSYTSTGKCRLEQAPIAVNTNIVTQSAPTGLGTMSTQDADDVNISGGVITGITDLAVADGGTGSSTAGGARTNLGVAIGSNVQAWDDDLDDIAALSPVDSNIIVGDGTDWVAESGATARTSLGLGTGDTPQFARLGLGAAADGTHLLVLGATTAVSSILDEDTMVSDSATALATQQSIKAYVDTQISTEDTLAEMNDVDITAATAGELIIYNATSGKWEDATLTGAEGITITNADASITIGADGALEDLDALGAASADGEFIVATGAGVFAYESGATVRTSLGLVAGGGGDIWVEKAGDTMSGDLIIYDATNDGNPQLRLGAADAEELHVQAVYDTGAQTLDYILFQTDAASATANKGLYRFNVDGTDILDIDDGGIDLATGLGISINGTALAISDLTFTAGTGLTLSTDTLNVNGVLEDLDTLGAAASDGQFIVATGAGAFAYESGATALASLGLVSELANLTSTEVTELEAIGATTISATQWGYLGGLDQALTTTDSPQFSTIELGHASDTTLSRSAAGVLAVEGTDLIQADGSITMDTLPLGERSSDPSNPSEGNAVIWMSDGAASGDDGDIMAKVTAGGITVTETVKNFSANIKDGVGWNQSTDAWSDL